MTDHIDALKAAANHIRGQRGMIQGEKRQGVSCFMPKGNSAYFIYAVSVVDHAGVVKVGRTVNWKSRSKAYSNWNLRLGDGIDKSVVYRITEEYVDLEAVEAEMLFRMREGFEPYRALEWFKCDDIECTCRVIEQTLWAGGLSYEIE